MQVSEVKTSSSASNLVQAKRQPFFNKEGQDSFFFKSNETTTSFFSPTTIQPKLTIGQPNDKYEVEADAMADKVVQKLSESDSSSTSESQIPEIQAKCNTCDKEEEVQKKEEEEVHAKEDESPAIEEQVPELQQKPIFESNTDEAIQAKIEPTVAEPIMTPVKISPAVPTPITQPAVQAKCDDCEKEAVEEGEEVQELQRKEAHGSASVSEDDEDPNLQLRSLEMEKTGYPILFKKMPNLQLKGSTSGTGSRERIVEEAQKMVGKIEAKKDDGSGKRVGAEHFLEIFHLAANDAWSDEVIENVKYGEEFPYWCGIFSVYAIKKAGIDLGYWQIGRGVGDKLQPTDNPQPGDIGYFHHHQHHCIIKEVNGDTIVSIDGNSAVYSEVVEKTRQRSAFTGGFMTAFTGSETLVQKKEEAVVSSDSGTSSLQDQLSTKAGSGAAMDLKTQSEMESGFGVDFSGVNIHTDSTAVQMNKDLNAQAFTHGNDIYFNEGKYDTNSTSGKHLLAHELTHTVQQGANTVFKKPEYPTIQRLGKEISNIQKKSAAAEEGIAEFYKTGDEGTIQRFNVMDVLNSMVDLSEYLDLDLPDSPIEALELMISTMENSYVKSVLSGFPGYNVSLLALKSALATYKAIEYIIDNKDKIIAEIMQFIDKKLDSVKELVREQLESAMGSLDDRHFSIIWNVHMLPMLEHLKDNWQETVKTALWEQIWPFEGITSITDPEPVGLGKNLVAIWDHIKGAFNNLKEAEFSKSIDDILMMQKEMVALTNRFYGWVAIAIIASETIAGAGGIGAITAGTGTAAGAAVGFGAGLATAGTIGEVLLAVTIAADAAVLLKSFISLNAVDSMLVDEEKMKENNIYYGRIAQSSISIGLMVAMLALAYIGGKIAELILSKVVKFLPESILEILEHVKTGMVEGRPVKNGELDPPNVRENPPELNAEFNTLKEKVNNPENIRTVNDAELSTKYDVEVTVGDHVYRRRMIDGKWCRFSTPVCGLDIDGINATVDANTPDAAPVISVPTKIQAGEQLTVPIQGNRRVRVESVTKETVHGTEFTIYELRLYKDSRKGFDTGSTQKVTDVTLDGWMSEGKVIRWTEERVRLMKSRPEYRDGLVDEVWNASKSPDGTVRDPNNPELELSWDKSKSRFDQWHMGHKKGHEYRKLVDDYIEGRITWDEFIAEYNNPKSYHAEHPIENISHKNEAP
ncbi:DUF4157 domain-containing protein [Zobellia sp. 1_MG-2023]|uniref:eCIS core domain-containing protein n=1 Tax=Zobellia sp. 1_MG-2023 TaxID=3062626 RepID=UPI0026E4943E|nr:DUF4157 domain-containing protein [Zobellia sp. 1_MG-2023]MDO6818883.1 DUF4157 domain-containing protein [Zobellia sp. 1_MG-2023]